MEGAIVLNIGELHLLGEFGTVAAVGFDVLDASLVDVLEDQIWRSVFEYCRS